MIKSPPRLRADHIGMTLTKAEALFHLTEFEQALLHFHNGLVGVCRITKQSTPRRETSSQVLDPGNESFNLGIRRCRRTLRQLLPRNIFQVCRVQETKRFLLPCSQRQRRPKNCWMTLLRFQIAGNIFISKSSSVTTDFYP